VPIATFVAANIAGAIYVEAVGSLAAAAAFASDYFAARQIKGRLRQS
jgi:hypothetical protein